jgi:hypothetical protein
VDTVNLADALIKWGPAGLVILLFVLGYITPRPGTQRLEQEAERWRQLYETERAAHETTRKAHAEEIRPILVAGVEAARTAEHLLTEVKAADARERR